MKATEEQLLQTLDIKKEEIIHISAKTGINCDSVLDAIVQRLPA